ncbi:hypothetical protein K474DRAFT_458406 [Panus rudis PR-1116 ss-1]|nr:hypothetical protein K474DRAFT_458406 [Panus rudis PR-1116 ss-1]
MTLSKRVLKQIQDQHVQQLARFSVKDDAPPEEPGITKEDLLGWIEANPAAIKAARDSKFRSPSQDSPNWDAVLFCLIETTALYLRNEGLVKQAIAAAKQNDAETAKQLLSKAQADVDIVANALGCTFVQLCDFTDRSPDGIWFHSGAYSGAFVSTDPGNPFVGVSHKQ